jgi:hypothetical protein
MPVSLYRKILTQAKQDDKEVTVCMSCGQLYKGKVITHDNMDSSLEETVTCSSTGQSRKDFHHFVLRDIKGITVHR